MVAPRSLHRTQFDAYSRHTAPSKPAAAWKSGIAGAGRLSRHLIGAFPGGVLGRFDLCAALVSEDADEAAHGVLLPVRGLHNLGQRRSLGPLHQGDDLRLLVGPAVVRNRARRVTL